MYLIAFSEHTCINVHVHVHGKFPNMYDKNMHAYLYCTCTCRCFDKWTPGWMYHQAYWEHERKGRKSPYFPTFYGDMRGLFHEKGESKRNYLSFDITKKVNHQSLVTLEFEADSVAFVDNR